MSEMQSFKARAEKAEAKVKELEEFSDFAIPILHSQGYIRKTGGNDE